MTFRLLICDLDNTLYDWVTMFTTSFRQMVAAIAGLLNLPEEQVLAEFRTVHQRYGNSEQPYAALELPSVHKMVGSDDPEKAGSFLDPAFYAFNKARKSSLREYPGVTETLALLRSRSTKLVAHTESIAENALWRLDRLDLLPFFDRIYCLNGERPPILKKTGLVDQAREKGLLQSVPRSERKPNPALLFDICAREGISVHEAVYVGDSLTRDIFMARQAGAYSVWAKYGIDYDPELWTYLVKASHWTPEDVEREANLKALAAKVRPDREIRSFGELQALF